MSRGRFSVVVVFPTLLVVIGLAMPLGAQTVEELTAEFEAAATAEGSLAIAQEIQQLQVREKLEYCTDQENSEVECRVFVNEFIDILNEYRSVLGTAITAFAIKGVSFSQFDERTVECNNLHPDYEREGICLKALTVDLKRTVNELFP